MTRLMFKKHAAEFFAMVEVPKLVLHARSFENTITGICAEHLHQWNASGCRDAINKPEDRH